MIFKFAFIERWYERTKDLARHRQAEKVLGLVSFSESIIFPIPTSVMLIAMVQSDRSKAWRYASIAAIASVIGAVFGYLLGWFAFDTIMRPILESIGKADAMAKFETMVQEHQALAVFGAGLTPFPFKVITIMGGMLHLNFLIFILASIVSRFAQFFIVAAVVWKFGDQAEALIKKHFAVFTIGFFALVVGAWALWHYVLSGSVAG